MRSSSVRTGVAVTVAGFVTIVLSCGGPTVPSQTPGPTSTGGAGGAPTPAASSGGSRSDVASGGEQASAVIGPQGGAVSSRDGAEVKIPAGALASLQNIRLTKLTSAPPGTKSRPVGGAYRLDPDGTFFAQPVTVTLAIDASLLPAGKTASDVVVYTAPSGSSESEYQALPTRVVDKTHVAATTTHFSDFWPFSDPPTPPPPPPPTPPPPPGPPLDVGTCGTDWDATKWNPSEPDAKRPAYCACAPPMPKDIFPHPKSMMARYAMDEGCSRHHGKNLLCSNPSPVNPVSAPAKACVDLEFVGGRPAKTLNDPAVDGDQFLTCVECPDSPTGLQPNLGRACTQDDFDVARRGTPIFNLRGDLVERLESLFDDANKIISANNVRKKAGQPVQDVWKYRLELLTVLRLFAPAFGYCTEHPYGTTTSPDWQYAAEGHRMDLNRNLFWSPGTTLKIVTQINFAAGFTGFAIDPDADPAKFDLFGLGLALAHEMRHMGTKNFGGGDLATLPRSTLVNGHDPDTVNFEIAGVEHMLNEVEDYKIMFQHPFVKFMDPETLARLHKDFRAGEDQERACFAWQWLGGFEDSGYPPDKRNQRITGQLQVDPKTDSKSCGNSDPLMGLPIQRCAVALWANGNGWMQAQMLRSVVPTSFTDWQNVPHPGDAEPWNVLAHWAMVFPFRNSPYCLKGPDGQPRLAQ
jgi:hypothetical protein